MKLFQGCLAVYHGARALKTRAGCCTLHNLWQVRTGCYLDGSLIDPRQLLLILSVYGSATMLTQQEVARIIHGVATWLVDFCLFWRGLTLRACDDAVLVVI